MSKLDDIGHPISIKGSDGKPHQFIIYDKEQIKALFLELIEEVKYYESLRKKVESL